jgi:hypothetical protein
MQREMNRCRRLSGVPDAQCGGFQMYQMLRLTIVAMAVVVASLPTSAPARDAVTQIKLTEKHVEGFIAAQKGMSTVVEKMMPGAVFSNRANARYGRQRDRDMPSADRLGCGRPPRRRAQRS